MALTAMEIRTELQPLTGCNEWPARVGESENGPRSDDISPMIFSIQRFLEDHFQKRRLEDPDQYAVSIANLYDQERARKNDQQLLVAMHRVRTVFFRSNSTLDRAQFEKSLLRDLDGRFKKKAGHNPIDTFPGGVVVERKVLLKQTRRTIQGLLTQFKSAVESRCIDSFWISRKQNNLRERPESIAQGLLAVFAKGVVNDTGLVLRELVSGIGFVDVSIVFSARPCIARSTV